MAPHATITAYETRTLVQRVRISTKRTHPNGHTRQHTSRRRHVRVTGQRCRGCRCCCNGRRRGRRRCVALQLPQLIGELVQHCHIHRLLLCERVRQLRQLLLRNLLRMERWLRLRLRLRSLVLLLLLLLLLLMLRRLRQRQLWLHLLSIVQRSPVQLSLDGGRRLHTHRWNNFL